MDDAAFLEQRYPGVTFKRADGLNLPFESGSFDVVHSSAVLEHVGSFDNQRRFIQELVRVARRVVFLTTPNRWFPVEFHSVLPLIHWLPKPLFRKLLQGTRYHFFALEENLNLVDRGEILELCKPLGDCRIEVESQRLLGMSSNLLLIIDKSAAITNCRRMARTGAGSSGARAFREHEQRIQWISDQRREQGGRSKGN